MKNNLKHELSSQIKEQALSLGFQACGISEACRLEDDDARLNDWLRLGYQGEMAYMARNREKRTDPRLLMDGARSVISVLMNYFPEKSLIREGDLKIAKYAYGKDYHLVIRDKLQELVRLLKEKAGDFKARVFTDSAPVLDKAWAERAGLGWIGKNTCLIHPQLGSFVFIGEVITDLELVYDTNRINDLCGGCTRCIEACPTGAIVGPRLLDARRCISYLTIENRGEIGEQFRGQFNDWIFGCDICQDVCPWNRKARPHSEPDLHPGATLPGMTRDNWKGLTRGQFDDIFRDSAVQRTGFEGLRRNVKFVTRDG